MDAESNTNELTRVEEGKYENAHKNSREKTL
jgi:hypothetical protein